MSCIVYLYLPTSIQWTPSAGLNTAPRLGDQDQTVQTHGSREDIKKREIVREEDFDEHVRINPNPFSDPRNRTIRVVSIIAKPFLQFKESGYGRGRARLTGNDQFEGFCVDMLEEIGRLLGIRYEIHLVGDNSYGEKKSISPPETVQVMSLNPITGQPRIEHRTRRHQIWNGMIGEVVNGTADMAVAPVTINHARARVVDFSEPFLTFGISLIIKKPGKKKPGIFSFLHPLAYSVWLAILAACLVVSCGLWVIAKLSPLEWRYQTDPNTDRVRYHPVFTYFNSLWFSFAAFVQQVSKDILPLLVHFSVFI
ncbi:unnamed protein product [Protopolystoma xenopodis]|uniref:Ionotropic glutamate receptor L-glutamate and glycine-binding domain-containing protein n=1 Tax=Protopolystoma xenopodis TaxID=117903 RepID=A0A3S5A966_9PLAT|nr:unnamed protein product [Protopolystoma xenopodis]